MNGEKVVTYVFYAIFGYLILMNAGAFNSIVGAGGNFITSNIALLQGRSVGGFGGGKLTDYTTGGSGGILV